MNTPIVSHFSSVPPPAALDRFSDSVCGLPCATRGCSRFEQEQAMGFSQLTGIPPRQVPREQADGGAWLLLSSDPQGSPVLYASAVRPGKQDIDGRSYIEWLVITPPKKGEPKVCVDYLEAARWDSRLCKHVAVVSTFTSDDNGLYGHFGDVLFEHLTLTGPLAALFEHRKLRPADLIIGVFGSDAGCPFEDVHQGSAGASSVCKLDFHLRTGEPWQGTLVTFSYLHEVSGKLVLKWLDFYAGKLLEDKDFPASWKSTAHHNLLHNLLDEIPLEVSRWRVDKERFTFAEACRRNNALLLNPVETSGGVVRIERGEWTAYILYWVLLRVCCHEKGKKFKELLSEFCKESTDENFATLLDLPVDLGRHTLLRQNNGKAVKKKVGFNTEKSQETSELLQHFLVFEGESCEDKGGIKFRSVLSEWLCLPVADGSDKNDGQDVVDFLNFNFGAAKSLLGLHNLPMYENLGWRFEESYSKLVAAKACILAVCDGLRDDLTNMSRLHMRLEACYTANIIPILPLLHQWLRDKQFKQYVIIPVAEAVLDQGEPAIPAAWAHIMSEADNATIDGKIMAWKSDLGVGASTFASIIASDQAQAMRSSKSPFRLMSHSLKDNAAGLQAGYLKIRDYCRVIKRNGALSDAQIKGMDGALGWLGAFADNNVTACAILHLVSATATMRAEDALRHYRERGDEAALLSLAPVNLGTLLVKTAQLLSDIRPNRRIVVAGSPNPIVEPAVLLDDQAYSLSDSVLNMFLFEILLNSQKYGTLESGLITLTIDSNKPGSITFSNRTSEIRQTEWRPPANEASGLAMIHAFLERFDLGGVVVRHCHIADLPTFQLRLSLRGIIFNKEHSI